MKRFYITIIVLLGAMITLAYLYFSKLNRDTNEGEASLYAATAKSGLVFVFENEKSILELLASQNLLQRLIPKRELNNLRALQKYLLSKPELSALVKNENIYLSFLPGEQREIDFLISTQTTEKLDPNLLYEVLTAKGIKIENQETFSKLTLADTSVFYLAQKKNLILLSPSYQVISESLKSIEKPQQTAFIDYIKANSLLSKNSLATIYLNFDVLEGLLKQMTPNRLKQEFSLLNQQQAFANLSYRYSKDRVLFNGYTTIQTEHNYLNLFSESTPEKVTIDAILPESTASYAIYMPGAYKNWKPKLNKWFQTTNKSTQVDNTLKRINTVYRLDPNLTFPQYFKNQMVTFRLKSRETLGAINLSNGDKLRQLLIDLSTVHSDDISIFKEDHLLYSYFGEAFENFKRPYYTIVDNYLVFSNRASTVQSFLYNYRNNKQLINKKAYREAFDQLSTQSNVIFYVDHLNSERIALQNLYLPYYRMYSSVDHLGEFDATILQLTGDQKNFQTNMLLSKVPEIVAEPDSIPSF
ncbi:hypothetical protein IWX76_000917 [Pedobacter sp. CAN_A7]|uniref:DUF3352 domain-containing protein n=1 Tax=Pedobacter sp. CAN_A7 TaxID=2787722 RepID=UPI0018C9D052